MVSTAKLDPAEIIENLRNQFMGKGDQRQQLDFVRQLNELHAAKLQKDAALEARLEAFEMAFKMQTEASDAFDVAKEPAAMRELYGPSATGQSDAHRSPPGGTRGPFRAGLERRVGHARGYRGQHDQARRRDRWPDRGACSPI